MGGNAFTYLPRKAFPRLPPELYTSLKARLKDTVEGLYSHVVVPREAPGKQDYGDIDLVVCSPRSGLPDVPHVKIQEALNACHVLPADGNRTSNFAVPISTEYKEYLRRQHTLDVGEEDSYFCQVSIVASGTSFTLVLRG